MTGVHCLVSPDFFDALTSHAKVKEAYERWQEGAALRDDMRSGFTFGGITFEEYRGQATDPAGAVRKFIADSEGHCFPTGTAESFVTYFAPAENFLPEQVNQAATLALNRTAEWMKGQVSRELSAEKRLKLKAIRDQIAISRANKKNLQSLLNCNFRGVLARDLGSLKQTPAGAKAGGRLFPGAFIATLRKGAKPGIYRRKSKARFPVKSVTIPIFDEATKIIETLIGDEAGIVFEKRFRHEINRLTGVLV